MAGSRRRRRSEQLCRSAQRRDRRRHRARGARRLYRARARQALDDARHGHRPGQDRQRNRAGAAVAAIGTGDRRDRHDHFPRAGETMDQAVRRECLAARDGVALLDASTLGKIEISGRDAARFLDRIYINRWSDLPVGRCRYGVMCRDDGMVFDDGVGTRLGPDRFFVTTTTGNAGAVLDWFEEWLQTEWPELDVFCTSLTEEFTNATLVGPRSREVLSALAPQLDLGDRGPT